MSIVFPQLLAFRDVALLLVRLMVALNFLDIVMSHARDPFGLAESIWMITSFKLFIG
jgi:hypothetical protein